MRKKRILGLAVGLGLLIALACSGGSSTLPVGEEAPNIGVQIKDKASALSDYRGQVVLVNFWSST